jgi:mycothiol synthase
MHATGADARRLDIWAYNCSAASSRLAGGFGFAPARRLLHLHRHAGGAPEAGRPAGVAVRPFRRGADEATLLALNNRIFAGHPEQGTWTMDDLAARMAQPWFDAGDVLMLESEGAAAGFCWLKVEERRGEGRVGEVYVIGVAPEQRGSGSGRWLLAEGLRRLGERAVDVAAVYVDESNGPAVRAYEDAGFHYHHVDVCYTRELASQEAADAGDAAEAAA